MDGVRNVCPPGSTIAQPDLNVISPIPLIFTVSSLNLVGFRLSLHLMYNVVSSGTE